MDNLKIYCGHWHNPLHKKSIYEYNVNVTNHQRKLCSFFLVILIFLSCQKSTTAYSSGYYMDNGFQTKHLTRNHHLPIWKEQEKLISKELLTMLGLDHKPKVVPGAKKFKSAPKFMMDLYKQIQYDEEYWKDSAPNLNVIHYNVSAPGMNRETGDADLIMSFENQVPSLKRKNSPDFLFDFSEVPATESVYRAELRLYKYPMLSNYNPKERVNKYQLNIFRERDDSQNSSVSVREKVTTTFIDADYSGWFDIEITNVVQDWLIFPFSNSGLYISIIDYQGREIKMSSFGIIDDTGPSELHPFLVTFFQAPDVVHVRQKRSANKSQKKKARSKGVSFANNDSDYLSYNKCHREALYINFSDLNWQEWIIAPEGYAAFHCTGQCTFPLNSHMNATNHAIVQTLVSLMEPSKVPLPYCTPTKMAAISVLYFDDKSNVILKRYKNMVVKACGCH